LESTGGLTLLKDNSDNLLKECFVVLGAAVRRLKVLEDQVLSCKDLKHTLDEAVVELLSVVLHHNISVALIVS
jgi:hypothetical protein